MTFTEFISYFETAAINNKALLHQPTGTRKTFYTIDIEEILKAAPVDLLYMSMLLECPEYKPFDAKSDNIRSMTTAAFVIMQEATVGDRDDRNLKLANTKIVAQQILAKMINDNKKFITFRSGPAVQGFDVNSSYIQKVGPLMTNHYGWRVEFTFNQTFENNLYLDENDWNNETKFSII